MMRRRGFILSSIGLAVSSALAQSDLGTASHAFISPDGDGSGNTWDDPAAISEINRLINDVGPSGTIILRTDRGVFNVREPLKIATGGDDGAPITIMGAAADGTPQPASLKGSRKPWPGSTGLIEPVEASSYLGEPLFILENGAQNLRFSHLDIMDFGRFLDMTALVSHNIQISDVTFSNLRDGIVTNDKSSVENVLIQRFSGRGFSKKAIRFHGTCSQWRIEDCELDSAWQYGDSFAVGIEAADEANGLHIIGGHTINCLDTRDGDEEAYWNGDGVASERDNFDILIENHRSAGNSDAGYDLKSELTTIRNCVSEDNKRNFRIWGGVGLDPVIITKCQSVSPYKRGGSGGAHHIWLDGAHEPGQSAASIIYSDGIMRGGIGETAIYADGGNIAVHIIDTDISALPAEMALFTAKDKSSKILIGSATDPDATELLTDENITLMAGAIKTVDLETSDPVTWRLVPSDDQMKAELEGASLSLQTAVTGPPISLTVQARNSRGEASKFLLQVVRIQNPVAPGAVFSFATKQSANGWQIVDRTTLNTVSVSDTTQISEQAFHFAGKSSYFEVENTGIFDFAGSFSIEMAIELEKVDSTSRPDILTVWKTSDHDRAFRLGIEDDGALGFFWSSTGRLQEENVLLGPKLATGRKYTILVERDAEGFIQMSVNGEASARTATKTEPFKPSPAPLRVSGRPDGDRGAFGHLTALTIINNFSQ